MTSYDWAGSRTLPYTVVWNRRYVRRDTVDIPVGMDVRQWVVPSHCWELRNKTDSLFTLPGREPVGPMDFDKRARLCWKYVVDAFTYRRDVDHDLWLLPSETLVRRYGDCEDLSFLLASLLLIGGISPDCVRVVFGPLLMLDEIIQHNEETGDATRIKRWRRRGTHAWVVYKNAAGCWCLLDPTIESGEITDTWIEALPSAGDFFEAGIRRYKPEWCCNHEHVWAIDPMITRWEPGLYADI